MFNFARLKYFLLYLITIRAILHYNLMKKRNNGVFRYNVLIGMTTCCKNGNMYFEYYSSFACFMCCILESVEFTTSVDILYQLRDKAKPRWKQDTKLATKHDCDKSKGKNSTC